MSLKEKTEKLEKALAYGGAWAIVQVTAEVVLELAKIQLARTPEPLPEPTFNYSTYSCGHTDEQHNKGLGGNSCTVLIHLAQQRQDGE